MTQDSLNNYIASIQCCLGFLSSKLSCEIQIDSCEKEKTAQLLEICSAMYKIICCYQLQPTNTLVRSVIPPILGGNAPQPPLNANTTPLNCLTPDQMQCMSQFLNKICNTTYCVDFVLTPLNV